MEWSLLYSNGIMPTLKQVADYIDNSLWTEFNSYMQMSYQIDPIMEYSRCSMQRGWNLKYKKSGKTLCTLYPMSNYFTVLIVVGDKEMQEAEFLVHECSSYVQDVIKSTKTGQGQKWLMIDVREFSANSYTRIMDYITAQNTIVSGAPIVCFHNMDLEKLDIEVGFPIVAQLDGFSDIQCAEIPAQKVVTAIDQGPYELQDSTLEELLMWIKNSSYEMNGEIYYQYLNTTDRPATEYLTKMILPIH